MGHRGRPCLRSQKLGTQREHPVYKSLDYKVFLGIPGLLGISGREGDICVSSPSSSSCSS